MPLPELNVYTDLSHDSLTRVGLEIFRMWVDFAMGGLEINGKRIAHPTGRYASAIRIDSKGPGHVAVIVDEWRAPEAAIIESGHGAIDMKRYLEPGRVYPMHRGGAGPFGGGGGAPRFDRSTRALRNNIWAQIRGTGFSGFAATPKAGEARPMSGWIIPPMAAYAPAEYFSNLMRKTWGI
jgi:hypothetical protein